MEPLLRIRDLSVSFCGPGLETPVLQDVAMDLFPGRVTVLLGPSGSGKSTLAAVLLGVLPVGQYRILSGRTDWREGEDRWTDLLALSPQRRKAWWGRRIGQIVQEPAQALNPVMRVGAQLQEVCRAGADLPAMRELLASLGLDPERYWNRYPWELSGGQQQRVLLAMTLFPQPGLILADEPTAALDRHHQGAFLDLLRGQLNRPDPPALLLVTHDHRVAAQSADEVVILEAGRITRQGSPGTILPPERPVPPFQGRSTDRPSDPDEVLLEARGLRGGYQPGNAVVDIDHLHLRQGEILGLAGPSGSGKSSLLRALLGLLPWQDGVVISLGTAPEEGLRGRIFPLIYQDAGGSFNPVMTIGEAFNEILRLQDEPSRSPSVVLARLDLPEDSLQRMPHQFSGGQKQRLAIARAMLGKARVLLCDEPFSSLDSHLQEAFLDLLRRLCMEEGMAALLVAHDLPRLLSRCDRVAIMDQGRIRLQGTPSDLLDHPDPFFRSLID